MTQDKQEPRNPYQQVKTDPEDVSNRQYKQLKHDDLVWENCAKQWRVYLAALQQRVKELEEEARTSATEMFALKMTLTNRVAQIAALESQLKSQQVSGYGKCKSCGKGIYQNRYGEWKHVPYHGSCSPHKAKPEGNVQ